MQPQGGGSGRKRNSRRKKSTPSADVSSNSKASETQSNQPPHSGSKNGPRCRKGDSSPSTSSRSNAVKKPRACSSRRRKSKKNQRDLHNESESDDQVEVANNGGQQQANPPVSKSRAKNDPKTIEKENQDLDVPIQKGSRRSRKKATTESNSSNKFNSKNDIKEVSGSQMPLKSAKYGPKLTIKFDPNKAIRKEADGSGPPFHGGLQTFGKKATYEPNLTIKYDPNKASKKEAQGSGKKATYESKLTKNEIKSSEPANPRAIQIHSKVAQGKEAATKPKTSMFDLDVIMAKETNAKLPVQRGSRNPSNKAPEPNLIIKIDPNKLIKKGAKSPEPPNQKGLQMPPNKAFPKEPTTNSTTKMVDQKTIMRGDTNAAKLPVQRNYQIPRNKASEPNLTIKIDPRKLIKKGGKSPDPPNQKGLQMLKNKALHEEPTTKSNPSMFNNGVMREVANAKLPVQRGSRNPSNKTPEPNFTKLDPTKQQVKRSAPSNQKGLQMPPNKAPRKEPTTNSTTKMVDQKTIMRVDTNAAKLPVRRNYQNPRNKAPEPNLIIKIDPNKLIKKGRKSPEPPNQRGSQMLKNKALHKEPTTKSNPSIFDLDNDVIMEETNAKLPVPRGSRNPNIKAPGSKVRIRYDPNKIIKTENGDVHWGAQNYRKAAPDSNSWVKCNPNQMAKNEVKHAELPVQRGPQSSMTKASNKDTTRRTLHPTRVTPAVPPMTKIIPNRSDLQPNRRTEMKVPPSQLCSQGIKKPAPASAMWSSLGINEDDEEDSQLPTQEDIIKIEDGEEAPQLPIQGSTDSSMLEPLSNNLLENDSTEIEIDLDFDRYTNIDPSQIIDDHFFTQFDPNMGTKQEYTIPIDQNNVQVPNAPPQGFDNQFNPNIIIKEEAQGPPSHYYPSLINPNIANPIDPNQYMKQEVQQPSYHYYPDLINPYDPNQCIKEEVQEPPSNYPCQYIQEASHYYPTQINPNMGISLDPNQCIQEPPSQYYPTPSNLLTVKQEVQDSDLHPDYDPNKVIKQEKRACDLPLYPAPPPKVIPSSDSLNWQQPQSVDDDPWASFCPDMFADLFADGSTAGNSADCFNTTVQSHQSWDFAPSEGMPSQRNTGSNGSGFIDPSMASHNYFASRDQSNPRCDDGLSFDVAGKPDAQVSDSISSEEAAMDARLGAELASLYSEEGLMPETEEQESAVAKKKEAEIDARLQAELDSLPFIEAPVEAPVKTDIVDILLSSLVKPDPQTAKPSNAVAKQVVPPKNPPTASTTSASSTVVPAKKATTKVANLQKPTKVSNLQKPPQPQKPVPGNKQRPLSQTPMVAKVTGLQGQIVSLTYTTAPDGLVTSVSTNATEMPMAQANALQSLTAAQLHQILQSGQPYLALPMIVPGGQEDAELGNKDASGSIAPTGQAVEDEEVDYEEIGVADTFAEYWPSKLKCGMAHPDPVVETATLSSVELPDITYELTMTQRTSSCLSALQLEAVIYACQAHEQILPSGERAGFLLGDGAGVGKGRTIAGIIFDNFMKGRQRAVWVSVSNDLKFDAERDLHDIGADDMINVVAINKFKYSRIDSDENDNFKKGVIFCTYTALIGESLTANSKYKTRLRQLVCWLGKKFNGVIVFDECHKAKNLSMMNVGKSTKTGTTVLELQKLLPDARVVYASATGASEPRNMAYMVRLGLWGPGTAYPEFYEFVNAVEKRGIGAMEIVAMDMKLRGTYISRQLSFKEVTFRIEEVNISKEYRKTYNYSAELWAEINKKFMKACRLMCIDHRVQKIITCQFWCAHQRFFKNLCIASKVHHVVKMSRQATRMGKAVVIGLQSTGESRTLEHLERHNGKLSNFVSTSKMIIQSFVEKHFPAPKRDAFHRLLNTGEFEPEIHRRPPRAKKARISIDWFEDDMDAEAAESDIEMYENTMEEDRLKSGRKRRGRPPKSEKNDKITMQERILQHLCNNMRAQDNVGDATYTFDNAKVQKANITEHDVERCIRSREMLLEKVDVLGKRLPPNTLDLLISELGGTHMVAEMTGRRGRVVREELQGYKYEPRCENDISMDLVNYKEKQRFMLGKKNVAIISEAASSGISLQSDKRVSNQRRRLHITLELPWSADRAIQQFGRTHRSNQVNSPEYVFIITDLAGERRFASTVAKRLESLGALTQGDRRATDARDLSQFNIDNSIGRSALESVMQQLTGEKPLDHANVPASYRGDFLYDCSLAMAGVGMLNMREENKVKLFTVEKESNNISKFLNRILGCRVEVQNALFKFFLDKMYSLILQMKRKGHFDLGILDLDAHGACVKSVKLMRFTRKHATGTAATELHTVTVERGMSYDTALAKFRKEGRHDHEGFYVLQQRRHNKNSAIMCLQAKSSIAPTKPPTTPSSNKVSLQLYRPNTGPQVRLETLGSILARYVKVEPEAARDFWQQQYDICLDKCSHIYWNRACPFPAGCEVGLRVRPYHVLSGLMLPIWDRIEMILERSGHKIQIIRVKTDVNKKIVGTVVPQGVYDALVADLSSDSKVESL